MKHRQKYILLLPIMLAWLLFLYFDGYFSGKENIIIAQKAEITDSGSKLPVQDEAQIQGKIQQELDTVGISKTIIENASLQDVQNKDTNGIEQIAALEKVYQANKNPDILKILVQKLIQYHRFDQARQYLTQTAIKENNIDPVLYVLTVFNTIKLENPKEIEYFK